MPLFRTPAPTEPPPVEQVYNGASASTAYAWGIFSDAVDELEVANSSFDEVEVRTTAEISRLTNLRQDAADQRRANVTTIENLKALIG